MLLEITSLHVAPGQEAAFERAFDAAQSQLADHPGYITHELQREVSGSGRYALLVEWRDGTGAHTEAPWWAGLHRFLARPGDTHHYELIAGRGVPPPIPALRYPD